MTPKDLGRLFVRLNGFLLIFYAIIDATYLGTYIRALSYIQHPTVLSPAPEVQNLSAAVLRIALHLLLALFLLAKTDEIIDRILGRTAVATPKPDSKEESPKA